MLKIKNNKKHPRKQDGETTYWLSYSDMMAGLLLCFVLIIALTTLHSQIKFDQKEQQLLGKEQELVVQASELDEQKNVVAAQKEELEDQQAKLNAQKELLLTQEEKLNSQEATLNEQSQLLAEFEEIMKTQQAKLDRIIGIRSELIEELKEEFTGSSLNISVDEKTGAIIMDSNILFEYNKDELKDTGKDFLAEFLPRYAKILLSDKYRDYVSSISIEGHTDTQGNYLFNLDLSQKRAYSVAEYCLGDDSSLLSADQKKEMRDLISTNGKSYTDPILNDDGSVNMDASRRVEFLFTLKDEDMIREMIEILNEQESVTSESTDSSLDGDTKESDEGASGTVVATAPSSKTVSVSGEKDKKS
ncbi:OmpA family protein [Oribacterium sp. WCC10]|uniref:OmpA family protein n=1 Tax=Oribacterium sp. WCC10 TaxID=1855343 RepID=UPI0008E54081|nr:OmpA family protein [Oribacterium sp. WCC10]SFG19012.1 chemotaxis protein MotB [Oribacterium sp. WCC10]